MHSLSSFLQLIRDRSIMFAAFVPIQTAQEAPIFQSVWGATSLSDFLNRLFITSISIGAILAVIKLMVGGYRYMMSGLWTRKEDAKVTLQNAVLGLLILLGAYLVLYQINPCILSLEILNGSTSGCQVQR